MESGRGQVVLITGGAHGIGRATAELYLERGANVLIADVAAELDAVAAEIGASGLHLDVSDPQQWRKAIEYTESMHGRLDLLHLNAGAHITPAGESFGNDPLALLTEESYRRVLGVNADGVVFGILAARRLLEAQPGSTIIVTSSTAVAQPLAADPFYALAKSAVVGLVRSLAPSLAARGIILQAICPGGVDTRLVPHDMKGQGRAFSPPSYIAKAVADAVANGAPGDIWVALHEKTPPWRYEFSPMQR